MQRSLLVQLVERFSDLQVVLDDLKVSRIGNIDVLRDAFSMAISRLGQRRLTCFIDALDECDWDQVQDMITYFEGIGDRHYPYIHIENGIKLTLEDQPGHGHDLEKYVRSKLRVGPKKRIEEISGEVLQKSSGVFIWVVLVVNILNDEFKRGRLFAVKKRLKEIPPKLNNLFKGILTRDSHNLADLLLCVQWILFAKRPLRLEEFYFAAVSGLDASSLSKWNPEEPTEEDMNRFVLSSSKGLAEVTMSKARTVQFIHKSVRDFLLKDNGLRGLWPDLGDNFESLSHNRLKQCCEAHIQLDISGLIPSDQELPKASSYEAKTLYQDDVFVQLEYEPEFKAITAQTPVHWALAKGHQNLAWLLIISNNCDLEAKDSYGLTLLSCAAAYAHVDVVKQLLEKGADYEAKDSRNGRTPLSWAATYGHVDVVKQLLEKGADYEARDSYGRTPLSYAGHVDVVKQLEKGGECKTRDKGGQTPLSQVVADGRGNVVIMQKFNSCS
ncbi:Uu.00g079440.m01.CDS01 [Anthostomella pinea]|uniref:Uu.00g079440.m01.CDS01 n=1 Tax=Anthostomella pinea TaxID=933095 RepID=A0AAI8VFF2_9PEZI|nr:Uu.00g079440.m01.CDS01 [Anthostomella pinea]